MQLSAAGVRLARADGAAGPDGRQPAGAAPGRGLGRLRAVRGRRGARPRRRHRRAAGPRASSTTSPTSSPSPTTARGSTTSTSTRWPASSATRRPSTPGPLQELERALRDSGYLQRGSDGQYRLSPKAMRQLGKALLRDVAQRMSGRQGQRELPLGRRRRRPVGRDPRVAVRRHRAVGRHAHASATRYAGPSPRVATRAAGVRLEIGDVEVAGDRGAHPGRRGAAGRHVVLDGDGRPLGADEADRAGAAHPDPVSRFRGDALQLIAFGAARAGDGDRAAHRARRPLGQGHQPPPRAAARQPALPQAPAAPSRCCSSSPTASRPPTSSRTGRCTSPTRRTR